MVPYLWCCGDAFFGRTSVDIGTVLFPKITLETRKWLEKVMASLENIGGFIKDVFKTSYQLRLQTSIKTSILNEKFNWINQKHGNNPYVFNVKDWSFS